MANKNDELLKRLLVTFRVEADEHLQAMASGLLALEKAGAGPEAANIVETIFREAHSLKGAARAVNLSPIESLCQSLESVFAALKNARLSISMPLLDLLHQGVDELGALLARDPEALQSTPPAVAALSRALDAAANGVLPAGAGNAVAIVEKPPESPAVETVPPPPPSAAVPGSGTVRISTQKLDAVMRQAEELLMPRLAARQRSQELHDTAAALAAWKKARKQIQPSLRQVEHSVSRKVTGNGAENVRDEMVKLLEYLNDEQDRLAAMEDRLARLNKSAARDQRTLASMSDSLLQDVKEMQLLPFSSLFEILPRLARELAREQGKEVELSVQGGEIEIDRRILEELKDPLIHLLRNAVDHGIEKQTERTAAGKQPQGRITLAVSQRDSGKVVLLFADDGAGIDNERVRTAARKLGLVSAGEEDQIDEHKALALVFKSGLSTSPIITAVSGRGLGLAIVREKVEDLGGGISIASSPGDGTRFSIILPMTLATLRGVLVRLNGRFHVVPSAGVERVARVRPADIRSVENRETIVIEGEVVSLADMRAVLEQPCATTADTDSPAPVVVLGQGAERVAFRVDELVGEQEILLKPLGPQLKRVRNVAGACVLGNGQVVPVLNVADLLKSSVRQVSAPRMPAATDLSADQAKRSILVAEDSITSRSLLKGILESAGYAVTTAVDGMEAYTALRTDSFDLLVSDVEMPRMDGFDLTARVRGDKHLAELPVVLVTALESREHRERGIDVGANAYIVKSSFDQSNLLETIRRLI